MAYLTPDTSRRRIVALSAVVAVHGAMALAILTGFAGGVIRIIEKQHLPSWNYFPPPPPETRPEPVPSPSAHPRAAETNPEITAPRDPMIDAEIKIDGGMLPPLSGGGGLGTTLPPLPPTPPSPTFTPRAAKPIGATGKWVSDADYPTAAMRRGQQGAAGFELTIGPDGHVRDCRITRSSGSADLDAATCTKVSERASFIPARDEHGDLVVGRYAGVIRWRIPE